MVTKEAENRVSISIQNLPEFDADGTPLAYDIIPANRDGKISGAIYSGYEVRITHVTEFFRFPGGMEELPRTGFSSRLPYSLADKPLSINYAQTGLVLQIPSLDVIANYLSFCL